MSAPKKGRINIKSRRWHNPLHGTDEESILIYMDNVFVRIPIAQAYKVSNQIVDLAEQHDAETREEQHE